MEQTFFVAEKIWTFLVLPAISFIAGIILLFFKEWYPAIACFVLFFVFSLILIIWKELFFVKISISSNGIRKVLGKKVIKNIIWEQLVEVRALPNYFIYFLDNKYEEKTLLNYKTNVCFVLTPKKLNIILQYKDKFQAKITDISILSDKDQQNLLN